MCCVQHTQIYQRSRFNTEDKLKTILNLYLQNGLDDGDSLASARRAVYEEGGCTRAAAHDAFHCRALFSVGLDFRVVVAKNVHHTDTIRKYCNRMLILQDQTV